MESEDSGITEAEAKEFSSGEATQKEESEEEEDSDDLVSSKFNSFLASSRPPDNSACWKIIFFISRPKLMLWVLKRTVSMRRFF